MANPQKENGFIKIANELLEAFAKTKIGGKKRQILDFIIRKTYGFNKKQDRISLTQFEKGTAMAIRDVCRCINQLVDMKIIIKIQDNRGNIYGLNKDYDQWTELTVVKKDSGQKRESATDKIVHQPLTKMTHTKDNTTKDTLTKDITSEQSSQVQQIMEIFYTINPTLNWGNKTDRNACLDLIKQFGFPNTKTMAGRAVAVFGKPYAPRISKPYQLKSKLADLKAYFDSERAKGQKLTIDKIS